MQMKGASRSGVSRLDRDNTSNPDIDGIRISQTIRSGASRAIAARPSSPVCAVAMANPRSVKSSASNVNIALSSSIIRIFLLGRLDMTGRFGSGVRAGY
jgi:hypothetical protein